MSIFARCFNTDALWSWTADKPGNVIAALFSRWALPGQVATGETILRLALRDGYLNFYAKGQSIAKLAWGKTGPRLMVHKAYVEPGAYGGPSKQDYATFGSEALADPTLADLVPGWITTALTYASAEKRFVDDLAAANPGLLEVEMALPASNFPGRPRVAPRMDLVVAQFASGRGASIAFWEAKCANNPELRSSRKRELMEDGSFTGPRVLNQVRRYVEWLEEDDRIAQVRRAYRDTSRILGDLRRLFHVGGADVLECVRIWSEVAATENLEIVVQPGIVISNYLPEGSIDRVSGGRMAQCAVSFARNGHRIELERNLVGVHEVGPGYEEPILPALRPIAVGA